MMLLAPLIGTGSSFLGVYISYHRNLVAGGMVVVVSTTVFLLCWLFAPRQIALRRVRRSLPQPPTEASEDSTTNR